MRIFIINPPQDIRVENDHFNALRPSRADE